MDLVQFVPFSEFRHVCSRLYKIETGYQTFKTKSCNKIALCQDNRFKISRVYLKKSIYRYERLTKPSPFFWDYPVFLLLLWFVIFSCNQVTHHRKTLKTCPQAQRRAAADQSRHKSNELIQYNGPYFST